MSATVSQLAAQAEKNLTVSRKFWQNAGETGAETVQVAQVNVSLSKSVCDHEAGRLEQIFGKTA